jgi:hypothetical protein
MRRAPGLTMDASTRPGTPAADTIISADLNIKISKICNNTFIFVISCFFLIS